MAQNITLMGASYSAVPAVELPKTGGGTATFTDVTDTTAAADDVATGKYFYTSAGVKTAGTRSGGGGGDYVIEVEESSRTDSAKTDTAKAVSPNYTPSGDVLLDTAAVTIGGGRITVDSYVASYKLFINSFDFVPSVLTIRIPVGAHFNGAGTNLIVKGDS